MHIPESIHDYLVTFGVERETRPGRGVAWDILLFDARHVSLWVPQSRTLPL